MSAPARPAKPALYLAELETDSFSFRACATTETAARNLLIEALHKHGREHGLPPGWSTLWTEGINTFPIAAGWAYRDYQRILP